MIAIIITFSCISSFLFGYDLGLMGGALLYIKQEFDIGDATAEVIVGAAKLGAVVGTFLGGALMLHYGRRKAISIDSIFFIIGPIIMALSWNVAGLVTGRFMVGIGIGISAVVVPAYLGEVAPSKSRGRVVELYEVILCLGMLTSSLVDAALNNVFENWRFMVGAPAVPALFMSLAACMLPESPRWLVVRGRLADALAVIHRVQTNQLLPSGAHGSTEEVESELLDLWNSVEREKDAMRQRHRYVHTHRNSRESGSGGNGGHPRGRDKNSDQHGGGGSLHTSSLELARLRHNKDTTHNKTMLDEISNYEGTAGMSNAPWLPPKPPGPLPLPLGSTANPSRGSSRNSSMSMAECLDPVDDSLVIAVPSRLPRIRTRSMENLACTDVDDVPLREDSLPISTTKSGGLEGQQRSHTENNNSNENNNSSRIQDEEQNLRVKSRETLVPEMENNSIDNDFNHPNLSDSTSLLPKKSDNTNGNDKGYEGSDGSDRMDPADLSARPRDDESSFWLTLVHMMGDIVAVAHSPESSAFTMIIILAFFNQAFASTAIINYAPSVLHHAGIEHDAVASLFTSVVGASKLVGVLLAFFLIDWIGRRPLLVWGSIGCSLSLIALLIPADFADSHALLVTGMCLFIFSFSISWAGCFWVLMSESFSMGAKSPAASAATAVLFLTGALADLLFLSFHSWMGPFAFLLYGSIALISAIYVYLVVPETKGKTLQEVQSILKAGPMHESLPLSNGLHSLRQGIQAFSILNLMNRNHQWRRI